MLASDTCVAKYSASMLPTFTKYGNVIHWHVDKNAKGLSAELQVEMAKEEIIKGLTGLLKSKHTSRRTGSIRALARCTLHGKQSMS